MSLLTGQTEHGFTFAGSTPALVDDDHHRQPAVKHKHMNNEVCQGLLKKTES